MKSTRYFCWILIKLEFSRQIFEKVSNITRHKNLSSGSRGVPCGQTDRRSDGHDEAESLFAILPTRLMTMNVTQFTRRLWCVQYGAA